MAALTVNTAAWMEPGFQWARYQGVICEQFDADLVRYVDLIDEYDFPWVIEVGRAFGGTALLLADSIIPPGFVISIDPNGAPVDHPRVITIDASSTHPATLERVAQLTDGARGLVLLDGDHDHRHVEKELNVYAQWADYLIVEDTIMGDLPGMEQNGPHMALARWLPNHPEFRPDRDPAPTQHPGGWLRRMEDPT